MTKMILTKTQSAQEMGVYTETTVDTAKENAQMLIEYANGGSYTLNTKGIEISGQGVKERYDNGFYEVTNNKLEKLKKQYNIIPNF